MEHSLSEASRVHLDLDLLTSSPSQVPDDVR